MRVIHYVILNCVKNTFFISFSLCISISSTPHFVAFLGSSSCSKVIQSHVVKVELNCSKVSWLNSGYSLHGLALAYFDTYFSERLVKKNGCCLYHHIDCVHTEDIATILSTDFLLNFLRMRKMHFITDIGLLVLDYRIKKLKNDLMDNKFKLS